MSKENSATEVIDLTRLRYKIYVRKSTESIERQAKSLDDQESECRQLAERLNLNIVGNVIREQKSAKHPGKRPAFTQLIKEVERGEIDGILAWHPDRLARNTIDSGKIIYLLDEGYLKDLRFVTHQFTNDSSGKMMLGVLFIIAKNYSDNLSDNTRRGIKSNLLEGKSGGVPKHGYKRDNSGVYHPDGNNFDLITKAWEMRANGEKLPVIAEYLNNSGYTKYYVKDNAHRTMKVTQTTLSKMFKDSFYYGMLVQKDDAVDLRTLPVVFEPMISEDIYAQVQEISRYVKRGAKKKETDFLPFKELVFCNVCNDSRHMSVYAAKGNQKKYVYFKCRNKECQRKPHDVRAKVIVDEMEKVLSEVSKQLTRKVYDTYLQENKKLSDNEKSTTRQKIVQNGALLKRKQLEEKEFQKSLGNATSDIIRERIEKELLEVVKYIARLENESQNLETKLRQTQTRIIPPEEFDELIATMATRFSKKCYFVQKDLILRNLFSNIYFDNEKVVRCIWREPFRTLMRTTELSLGWGGGIRTPECMDQNHVPYHLATPQ